MLDIPFFDSPPLRKGSLNYKRYILALDDILACKRTQTAYCHK